MVSIASPPIASALTLRINLSDEQFFQLCQDNSDLKFERTTLGELVIMPPTGGLTGDRNADLTFQLRAWNRQTRLGKSFDSSTGFQLPNGANRSPDASWVAIERWNALTPTEQERFVPLCPDFVVELRSASDALAPLQAKLQEYMEHGARLGWLIDPKQQVVEIYRPNQPAEVVQAPTQLSGEPVLPGFVLDLSTIF
ncbi:Uma2 family endonuclease [Acaryochloris sp. CCMEE 5410]|uniref:Uma2 family endonuclease n=1 Tax=Acaryochloris sp. CCMEE 5410 TaxID=310037 RepID=UPI0002484A36|nr:Uma2 family endonuclease [Acaryochloris sp. CCMEE 5410]KAI9131680.1 Uma2 family endonuclease [Acaryochloris sp. CCMEE 5410]